MKKFISLYREIRRSSQQDICPRQALELAEQLLALYSKDQFVDENEWGEESRQEEYFLPVDEILVSQPGMLMRHERGLLDEVYEDDLFFSNIPKSRISYEWAVI
jgi:hypothetical protein